MSDAKITALTPEQAIREWEVIGGFLSKSLVYALGRLSLDALMQRVIDQEALILIAWEPEARHIYAAFYAEVEQYATGVRCFTLGAAGGSDIAEWGHLWPAFEAIARQNGCDQIEVFGRRGWKPFIDAREVATVFVKELGEAT